MADHPLASIAFLWPALAAASTGGLWSGFTDQFARLTGAAATSPPSKWATPSPVALELPAMRLRVFGAEEGGAPTLICAPFALHRATIADFARSPLGHRSGGPLIAVHISFRLRQGRKSANIHPSSRGHPGNPG